MDPTIVQGKLDALTKTFQDELGVSLWSSPPLSAFADIARPVTSHDELKARISSLVVLFEHFNKKEFDALVGAKSEGTRKAFVAFLKLTLPDDQPQVERDVEIPIDRACLLRDYLVHTKNRNYKKAFDFFELPDPILDAADAWSRVLFAFSESLDRLRELLAARRRPPLPPGLLVDEPMQAIVGRLRREKREVLGTPAVASALREIAALGRVRDADLAATFNLPVVELRRMLFPLTDSVLVVSASDRHTTILEVAPQIVELVKSGELFTADSG